MPNSRYDPADSRYWEEPESNEELDSSYYYADDPYDDDEDDRFCYYGSGDDEDDEPEFDCGFVPGHGCTLEEIGDCDIVCPYRDIPFSDRLVREQSDVLPEADQ
jgi:hypothetical protein